MDDEPIRSKPGEIFTIGHSNRDLDSFLALLKEHRIGQVVDVRRFPTSRKFPHFCRDALERELSRRGIAYAHLPELGGRRSRVLSNSPNRGWRVEGFNAYADHLLSAEGQEALERLEQLASGARTAILCAEAVPWRCHRQIIADHLLARGWRVFHVLGPGQVRAHKLPPFARVTGDGRVVYPVQQGKELFE